MLRRNTEVQATQTKFFGWYSRMLAGVSMRIARRADYYTEKPPALMES